MKKLIDMWNSFWRGDPLKYSSVAVNRPEPITPATGRDMARKKMTAINEQELLDSKRMTKEELAGLKKRISSVKSFAGR